MRGQTPKVPKQEKKKKPTGRAMKRIKYNRRFVNVGTYLGCSGCACMSWAAGKVRRSAGTAAAALHVVAASPRAGTALRQVVS